MFKKAEPELIAFLVNDEAFEFHFLEESTFHMWSEPFVGRTNETC